MCGVFNKAVDDYKCKDCMLKVEDKNSKIKDMFGQIFGKGFGEQEIYNTSSTKNKEKFTASVCEKWKNNQYTK